MFPNGRIVRVSLCSLYFLLSSIISIIRQFNVTLQFDFQVCFWWYTGRPANSNKYLSGWSSHSAALNLTHLCRSASFTCHFFTSNCASLFAWSPQPHTSIQLILQGIFLNSNWKNGKCWNEWNQNFRLYLTFSKPPSIAIIGALGSLPARSPCGYPLTVVFRYNIFEPFSNI